LHLEVHFTVEFRSTFYCCISKHILLLHFEIHFTVAFQIKTFVQFVLELYTVF
jgi:hypothetical protein